MEKMATNSKFVGRSTDIIGQSKTIQPHLHLTNYIPNTSKYVLTTSSKNERTVSCDD